MTDLNTIITMFAGLNPSNDPHGSMDKVFCDQCRDFVARAGTPETPLTLEEWKALRESGDYDAAFRRDILDAESPEVFLFVLRDRLVHTAGSTDFVISAISGFIDSIIDPRTVTRKEV